jgi:hypothetical protein
MFMFSFSYDSGLHRQKISNVYTKAWLFVCFLIKIRFMDASTSFTGAARLSEGAKGVAGISLAQSISRGHLL